jgi:hypothetical protein
MAEPVYARTLQRAADIVGGPEQLRERIAPKVSQKLFQSWVAGRTEPPHKVFLDAVDIVIEQKLAETFNAARSQRVRPQSDKKE